MSNISDVAKLAGVSEMTVSRVFNANGYVSRETKRAVLEAARQLEYRPNPVAVSLSRKSTKQLLMLIAEQDFENSYYISVYKGAAQYAEEHGYLLSVSKEIQFSAISKIMFDGVILSNASFAPEELKKELKAPATVVGFDEKITHPWLENIVIETGLAMELIIGHLRDMGHERIAFAMPPQAKYSQRYRRYLELLGGVFQESISEYTFGVGAESSDDVAIDYFYDGRLAAEQIVEKKPDVSAVACFNDEVAFGLIDRLQGLGVNIPEDLSVVGMDDILQSRYIFPALTTVKLPAHEQGKESARRIINIIEGKKPLCPATFHLEVMSRDSVKRII